MPRAITVHNLDHACCALKVAVELGVPVTLLSPPHGAGYLGAGYFLAMAEQASAEHPDAEASWILDCGDAPGLALGALARGCTAIRFTGPAAVRKKIADIAAQSGAAIDTRKYEVLDLLTADDALDAARAWLDGT
ncbi:MAG: hypothetical protein V3T02_01315 [Alphaproteobacteria bacterium]